MSSPIIVEAIRALVERRDLSRIESAAAMEAIMSGAATNAQIAAFLTALRMKGETVEELIGLAQVMRQKAVKVRVPAADLVAASGTDREMLIDTWGRAGTRRAPSTCRPPPRSWSRGRGSRWPSTATARCPRCAGRPTSWRPWGSTSS